METVRALLGGCFASVVEAEAGMPLAEALVKPLTGGDWITARFLFREFLDVRPAFKLWLAANHKPTISSGDHGISRRIRLVRFNITSPEPERDPRLTARLHAELPGILAWAVRSAVAGRAEGLGMPPEVQAATASYRDGTEVLVPFHKVAVPTAGARLTAREIDEADETWCSANGERAWSQKSFAMGQRERGFEAVKGAKGVRYRSGLRLRRDGEPGGGWHIRGASSEKPPMESAPAYVACAKSDPRGVLA